MAARKKRDPSALNKLKRDLKEGNLGQLYIFYGEEVYLRDYYLGEIKKQLIPEMEAFNYHRFEGKGLAVRDLSAAMDSLPVQNNRTMLVVDDYDLYKSGERAELLTLLSDIPPYCCLIFVYDTISYQPDARTKLFPVIRDKGEAISFIRQAQGDLVKWVLRRFSALGHDIGPKEAEYLIFIGGGLMTGLISEIEKIGAYVSGPTITKEDIDAVADPVLDAVVFQMTDAVAKDDMSGAASILGRLMRMQQPPIMILAVLGKQMRQLYSARLALEAGKDETYLQNIWKLQSSYPARLLLQGARRFDLPWCRRAVILCEKADLELKRSGMPEKTLLATLLMQLAAGPRKGT